jgi:hypothetical protein
MSETHMARSGLENLCLSAPAPGEKVERELDRFVEARDRQRKKPEGEREREALWAESSRRYESERLSERRLAWIEHHRRMRGVFWGLGDEHDKKLRALQGMKEAEDVEGHH